MTGDFELDPRLAAASIFVADLPLCQARLQDDARFPWIVLVPRRPGLVELEDLEAADRASLLEDLTVAAAAVRAVGAALDRPVERLNHGQLGLITPQLHVHVVGRRRVDAAWPGPVWGAGVPVGYGPARARAVEAALRAISSGRVR